MHEIRLNIGYDSECSGTGNTDTACVPQTVFDGSAVRDWADNIDMNSKNSFPINKSVVKHRHSDTLLVESPECKIIH